MTVSKETASVHVHCANTDSTIYIQYLNVFKQLIISVYVTVLLLILSECDDNYYGSGCSQRCSQGCVRRICIHINGTCQCQPGYIGSKCHNSKNFYMHDTNLEPIDGICLLLYY